MNNKYKLVGFYNFSDTVPSIIYPVFSNNSYYYIGHTSDACGDIHCCYTKFTCIFTDGRNPGLKFLPSFKSTLEIDQEYYEVGSLAICGFQTSKKDVYIGTIDKYLKFIKDCKSRVEAGNYVFKQELLAELNASIDIVQVLVEEALEEGTITENVKG